MSDQAMKLFEALSGVDEELLERCNRKVNRKNTAAYRLFAKYGRTMAACVCLIVVGAAAWSGYRFATGSCGADASGLNGSPAKQSDMELSILTADDLGGGTGSDSGMTGSDMTAADGTAGGRAESGSGMDGIHTETAWPAAAAEAETDREALQDRNTMAADNLSSSVNSPASPAEGSISEKENAAEKMAEMLEKEDQITDSREVISWEEAIALAPFAGYIPTALPVGYEPLSARRSSFPDSWNNMIYKWSEGEHVLSLDMTLGEAADREDIERRDGVNEYLAEEFRRELIPEPLDGEIRFTLYYADGMRIDFTGYITVDEMWEIVEAVSK